MDKHECTQHIPLAHKVCWSFMNANPHLLNIKDDLEGEALLALVEACTKYKDMGLIEFSTYAVHEIHNAMVNFLERNENRYNRHLKLEDLVSAEDDDGDSLSWQELIPGHTFDMAKAILNLSPESKEFIKVFLDQESDQVRATRAELNLSWDEYNRRKSLVIEEISESC